MAAKETSDMMLGAEEVDDEQQDDNYHTLLEEEKNAKKAVKPGQKAVTVRRSIEEYLERKWMREYYGVDLEDT
ncbi:MAG: hypothetical protein HY939_05500 [Gammaproteobacteria bacterium]|nr:hypothetical protein [Gammaproteobacteria bacterium]